MVVLLKNRTNMKQVDAAEESRLRRLDAAAQRDSASTKPRLLALTSPGAFSGLPDAVLAQLAERCEIVSVINGLRVPRATRVSIALRTFRPDRKKWGHRYYTELGRHFKRPQSLLYRIRYCEDQVGRLQGSYDLIYQFGALFGALLRPTGPPLVLHIDFTTQLAETYYPGWLPGSRADIEEWNGIEERIYHSASLIVVPTDLVAASLAQHYGFPRDRVVVIGGGAHLEDLTDDFPKPENRAFVFAGPDFNRHGGELAMEIFQGVRQRIPDATMTIVTNRSVNTPGVQNAGIVPRAELHQILRKSAILLVPGSVGGYQTVTEGMAAKCLCVIAENNPHMAGLIRHGTNGLAIRRGCTSEAVEVLSQHLDRPEQRAALGERARLHVLEECAWPRVVDKIWKEVENRFHHVFQDRIPPSPWARINNALC